MKRKEKYCFIKFVLIFLLFSSVLYSQNEKLGELSLEELLNISVTTASKVAEKISDAPGIISVITEKDIDAFGALTLFDLLDRVTGTFMHGSYARPHNMMSIRGDNTEFFNTRVLIMIDGRPIRESMHNGFNSPIYRGFPVGSISRIEIIRGPGSVLYGTTAYTGVINIITKSSTETNAKASVLYGTFGTIQSNVSAGTKLGDLQIDAGFNYLKSDGWDFTARGMREMDPKYAKPIPPTGPRTAKDFENSFGGELKLSYKNFTLNSFYGESKEFAMNRTNARWEDTTKKSSEGPNRSGGRRGFIDFGYTHSFMDNLKVTSNLTYNYQHFRNYSTKLSDGSEVDADRGASNDLLFEISAYFSPLKNMNIVAGGLVNKQTGERKRINGDPQDKEYPFRSDIVENPNPMIEVPYYDQTWYSGYFQVDYRPIDELKLILGAQANKATNIKLDIVPRFGAIYSITSSLTAKALFGQAFRAPSAFERSKASSWTIDPKNSAIIKGGYSDIPGSEKISTFEFQLLFNQKNFEIASTFFYSKQDNIIRLSRADDSLLIIVYPDNSKKNVQMYVNSGTLKSFGFEFEGKYYLTTDFFVQGSLAYSTTEDDKGVKDYGGMPKLIAKIGINYVMPFGVSVGLFNSYYGKAGDILAQYTTANPNYEPFNYLTANLNVDITKLLSLEKMPEIKLNFYGENLLNAKINYQNYEQRTVNTIPGRSGTAIYGGLSVKF